MDEGYTLWHKRVQESNKSGEYLVNHRRKKKYLGKNVKKKHKEKNPKKQNIKKSLRPFLAKRSNVYEIQRECLVLNMEQITEKFIEVCIR